MAIRCPGYGDVTWIVPMVVINSQRNRTFDGCTVINLSARSLCDAVQYQIYLQANALNAEFVCSRWDKYFEWSDMVSLLKFALFQGRNNGYSYAASGVSYTAKIVQNFVQHRIDHGRLFSFPFLSLSFLSFFLFFFFFYYLLLLYIIYEAK